jgi:lipopolysaccharide export LptBFGC system permease protein LptF
MMLKTLQWYIARELFKTFLLTAFGLTLVFSLCGGVLNMIQAEVLTAVQIVRILMFVLPVATTLTLPVSALFACAIVYGRFAADNEFDACKASGINIHRLLAPAAVLSVITAVFTFTFSNYVIPSFIEQLDAIVRADIQKVITQALNSRGYLKHGGYVLHARKAFPGEDPEKKDSKFLVVQDAAFLMLEKDALTRCGTAERVVVRFDPGAQGEAPVVTAEMTDVVALDLARHQLHQQKTQPFSPAKLPKFGDQNPKWLNLTDLFYYLKHPTSYGKISDEFANLRLLVREATFYRYAVAELKGPRKSLVLTDKDRRYEIRAAWAMNAEEDFRPTLSQAVVVETWGGNRRREYKADRCVLRVKKGLPNTPDGVLITMTGRAQFVDSIDPSKVNEPKQLILEEVHVPAELMDKDKQIGEADLLGITAEERQNLRYGELMDRQPTTMGLGPRVETARKHLLQGIAMVGLRLTSTIHSRFAFSACALVMLVLAAGLAIVFRGGQLLTAFVISFVPGLVVVVLNIMGRQMSENPPTHLVGLVVIWAGIGVLAIADAIVLMRFLRR